MEKDAPGALRDENLFGNKERWRLENLYIIYQLMLFSGYDYLLGR